MEVLLTPYTTALKVIARVQVGDRLLICDGEYYVSRPTITEYGWRKLYGCDRSEVIKSLSHLYTTIRLVLREVTINVRDIIAALRSDVERSVDGLNNLQSTYSNDDNIHAKIDSIKSTTIPAILDALREGEERLTESPVMGGMSAIALDNRQNISDRRA
jgi:hypothetical protein